jgi:hypothetical protein
VGPTGHLPFSLLSVIPCSRLPVRFFPFYQEKRDGRWDPLSPLNPCYFFLQIWNICLQTVVGGQCASASFDFVVIPQVFQFSLPSLIFYNFSCGFEYFCCDLLVRYGNVWLIWFVSDCSRVIWFSLFSLNLTT